MKAVGKEMYLQASRIFLLRFRVDVLQLLISMLFIADTVGLYIVCHNRALAPYGQSVTWEQLMSEMGHTGLEVAQTFCAFFKLPISPEEYKEKVASYYFDVFPTVALMKGI